MPFLIRIIAQRVAIFILGSLTFLGINPDIHVLSPQEIQIEEQSQQKIVQEILTPESEKTQEKKAEDPNTVENKIKPIAQGLKEEGTKFQDTVEQIISVPKIQRGETNLIQAKENFYDNVVVNIICLNKTVNTIKMTTGSGVIISPSGIILTNSHVANTFLFDDKSKSSYKDCSIRRENIPTYGFNAKIVYLSDEWLENNKKFFSEENPMGNGKSDYALLAITSNTNPVLPVPSKFDYAQIITSDLKVQKGDELIVAAYPGVHTGVFEVDSNGKLKKAETFLSDLMTYSSNSVDVISTGPNDVAKRGSSGGGVFKEQELLGIVVTTDVGNDGNYINAITLPYISADFFAETGENFEEYISQNKDYLISNYADDVSKLKSLISDFI